MANLPLKYIIILFIIECGQKKRVYQARRKA